MHTHTHAHTHTYKHTNAHTYMSRSTVSCPEMTTENGTYFRIGTYHKELYIWCVCVVPLWLDSLRLTTRSCTYCVCVVPLWLDSLRLASFITIIIGSIIYGVYVVPLWLYSLRLTTKKLYIWCVCVCMSHRCGFIY